ncbi:Fur family transcriptional regulator [Spirochaeta dissipatitropha]
MQGKHSKLIKCLKTAGFRMTPQRAAICEALALRFDHPTAQSLYEQVKSDYPSLSLTTVYQTLDTLLKLGAITNIGTAGDDSIHFEVNTDPHINLACLTCHRICDLESEAIRQLEAEVQEAIGSRVLSGRVVYYSECLENSDPEMCQFNPSQVSKTESAARQTGEKTSNE